MELTVLDAVMSMRPSRRQTLLQRLDQDIRTELGEERYAALEARIRAQGAEAQREWSECLREQLSDELGRQATDREMEAATDVARKILGFIAGRGARGRHPVSGVAEQLFILGRASFDEYFAGKLSITAAAEELGISKQAHQYQVDKMGEFLKYPLPGQRGSEVRENCRGRAKRQHAEGRGKKRKLPSA